MVRDKTSRYLILCGKNFWNTKKHNATCRYDTWKNYWKCWRSKNCSKESKWEKCITSRRLQVKFSTSQWKSLTTKLPIYRSSTMVLWRVIQRRLVTKNESLDWTCEINWVCYKKLKVVIGTLLANMSTTKTKQLL